MIIADVLAGNDDPVQWPWKRKKDSMTPLQSVSHQEWLERKIISRTYDLCYDVLLLCEWLQNVVDDDLLDNQEEFIAVQVEANEILLIRDLMDESE